MMSEFNVCITSWVNYLILTWRQSINHLFHKAIVVWPQCSCIISQPICPPHRSFLLLARFRTLRYSPQLGDLQAPLAFHLVYSVRYHIHLRARDRPPPRPRASTPTTTTTITGRSAVPMEGSEPVVQEAVVLEAVVLVPAAVSCSAAWGWVAVWEEAV